MGQSKAVNLRIGCYFSDRSIVSQVHDPHSQLCLVDPFLLTIGAYWQICSFEASHQAQLYNRSPCPIFTTLQALGLFLLLFPPTIFFPLCSLPGLGPGRLNLTAGCCRCPQPGGGSMYRTCAGLGQCRTVLEDKLLSFICPALYS